MMKATPIIALQEKYFLSGNIRGSDRIWRVGFPSPAVVLDAAARELAVLVEVAQVFDVPVTVSDQLIAYFAGGWIRLASLVCECLQVIASVSSCRIVQ